MQAIVDRYPTNTTGYLLPILTKEGETAEDLYRQYKTRIFEVNRSLHTLSEKLGLEYPITTYTARHSWASIAYNKRIPVAVISESMGHSTEKTTRIYLTSLDTSEIDKANRSIFNEQN